MKTLFFPLFATLLAMTLSFPVLIAQKTTYKFGETTYILGETYSTTGMPKVQRSSSVRNEFLRSQGYEKVPDGYEVDHIKPLSQGGADATYNMQLITKEAHRRKTAAERNNGSFFHTPSYNVPSTSTLNMGTGSRTLHTEPNPYNATGTPTFSTGTGSRTLHTGPKGGVYYYNSNGNKTYVKRN